MTSTNRNFHDAVPTCTYVKFRVQKNPGDVSVYFYDVDEPMTLEDVLCDLNIENVQQYKVLHNGVELNKELSLKRNGIFSPVALDVVRVRPDSYKGEIKLHSTDPRDSITFIEKKKQSFPENFSALANWELPEISNARFDGKTNKKTNRRESKLKKTWEKEEHVTFNIHLDHNEVRAVTEIGTITAKELKIKHVEKPQFTKSIESYEVLFTTYDGKSLILNDTDEIKWHSTDPRDSITFIEKSSNQCNKGLGTVTFNMIIENDEECAVTEIGTLTAEELKKKYAEKTPFTARIESYKVLVTHSDGKRVLLNDTDEIKSHVVDSNDCITFVEKSPIQCIKGFIPDEDVYNLDFSKPGKVVIVNVDTFERVENKRHGSEKDVESLCNLFTKMGMEIEEYKENKHAYFIRKYLKERIAKTDFTEYAMFVGVFMSHGNGDAMEGSDHDILTIAEIVAIIDQIPSLSGKPKIFILQMCRGNNEDLRYHPQPQSGSVIRKLKRDNSNGRSVCRLADCLIAQSTVPGYVSNRNETRGSWYIEELCKQLNASWETEDILTILTKVNKNMDLRQTSETQAGITYISKQLSSSTSMLTKTLFLSKQKYLEQCLQISESTKWNMKTEHIEILQRNYPYLIEEIDAKFLFPLMCDEKIFTLEDKKEIENLTTRSARNTHFFNQLLQSRQDHTYKVFIAALSKIYPAVAETVVSKTDAMVNTWGAARN